VEGCGTWHFKKAEDRKIRDYFTRGAMPGWHRAECKEAASEVAGTAGWSLGRVIAGRPGELHARRLGKLTPW
jgi:hypothetical protein